MTIVLVDYSQTVISSIAGQAKEFSGSDKDEIKNLIRHVIYSMILGWKKRFKGKMIIVCDDSLYWRKEEFPAYKGHRKKIKDESFLDWDLIYSTVAETKKELIENFPYPVLQVFDAEADDIIAVMAEYFQDHELVNAGLFDAPQEVVIVSTDGDMGQLQKYENVKQWNNVKKCFIEIPNVQGYLNEHIAAGDAGDNVPSVLNSSQWSIDRMNGIPTRAKPLSKVRLAEFADLGYAACKNEEEQKNWKRNEMLVSLDKIPQHIKTRIVNTYENYEIQGGKQRLYKYFIKNKMPALFSEIQFF